MNYLRCRFVPVTVNYTPSSSVNEGIKTVLINVLLSLTLLHRHLASRPTTTTAEPDGATRATAAATRTNGRLLLCGQRQTIDNHLGAQQRGVARRRRKAEFGGTGQDGTNIARQSECLAGRNEAQFGQSGEDGSVAVKGARRGQRPNGRGFLASTRKQTQPGFIGALRKSVAVRQTKLGVTA